MPKVWENIYEGEQRRSTPEPASILFTEVVPPQRRAGDDTNSIPEVYDGDHWHDNIDDEFRMFEESLEEDLLANKGPPVHVKLARGLISIHPALDLVAPPSNEYALLPLLGISSPLPRTSTHFVLFWALGPWTRASQSTI
ncbi:hypothetical protein BDR03DRAFT_1019474 [Suillus americanus]|nr:hypothetical protein BDR03DRAFT_1019474 [Suillus americanus]